MDRQALWLTHGKLLGYDDAGGCLLVVSEKVNIADTPFHRVGENLLHRLLDGGLLQTLLVEKLNSFVVSAKEMRQRCHFSNVSCMCC
jgi:hypothetical protein